MKRVKCIKYIIFNLKYVYLINEKDIILVINVIFVINMFEYDYFGCKMFFCIIGLFWCKNIVGYIIKFIFFFDFVYNWKIFLLIIEFLFGLKFKCIGGFWIVIISIMRILFKKFNFCIGIFCYMWIFF